MCGLFPVEWTGPDVEVAYHFARDVWSRGYATEAAGAWVGAAFDQLQLDRVVALAYPANRASTRVMEKLGMHFDREVEQVRRDARPVRDRAGRVSRMRVWVDFTNTAHVPVLRPLVELLEEDGHDVELTARPLSHTVELLDDWGHPYRAIGQHGGARRARQGRRHRRPLTRDAAVRPRPGVRLRARARLGRPAARPPACLRIPNTTMFDYEWATAQHTVVCRLANRVVVPEAIPPERLERYGARPPKLVQFAGPQGGVLPLGLGAGPGVLDELALDPGRVICVVRTAPSYALYLGGSENELLDRVLRRLAEEDAQTVVLARNDDQRRAARAVELTRFVVPERAIDGSSLVAFADVLVSAGGTMNREAAVLGTPVWSIFEGRLGGVDEQLVAEGRLRLLADPAEIELRKKPAGAASSRIRRDPRRLLDLALGL